MAPQLYLRTSFNGIPCAVAHQVSRSFDEYWNSPLSFPIASLVDTHPTEADLQAGELSIVHTGARACYAPVQRSTN